MLSFIKTVKALTVVINGKVINIRADHPMILQIEEELKKGKSADEALILEMSAIDKAIEGQTFGQVTVAKDKVYFRGLPMSNVLTQRIIEMLSGGYDIEPLALFMDNLMKNPIGTAREELYLFLESGNMPITPDGCFLAFKNVRSDLKSHHDGKTEHALGKITSVPRTEVDTNRENVCSRGLHFCSQAYLPNFHFGQGTTLVLKINPADVVAIPSDYSNAKGRAWQYIPIAILGSENEAVDAAFSKPVLGEVKGQKTFKEKKLSKKEKKADKSGERFNGLTASQLLSGIKKAGGVRPFCREKDLARSTVQGWMKRAEAILSR